MSTQVLAHALRIRHRRGRQAATMAAIATTIAVTGCATMSRAPRLTNEQRQLNLESFDYVWMTVHDKFFDPQFGGVDWEAAREEYRPKVERARTMPEARTVVGTMLSKLGKSHIGIIPAGVYDELGAPSQSASGDGSPGMRIRVVDGRALVTAVHPGSSAEAAGVKPGWEVLRVGERDVRDSIERVNRQLEGESRRTFMIDRAAGKWVRGAIGETLAFDMLDGNDKVVSLNLALREPRGHRAALGNLPPMYVHLDSRRLDGNIGYVAFNAFVDPRIVIAYNKAIEGFSDAAGIIIDLRGNLGGLSGMGMGMAGWFVDEKNLFLGTMKTRSGKLDLVMNPRFPAFTGPLAILVDELSASTAEFFAGGLKDLGRARIFGTQTAGAALPANIERLANGDGFIYAIANYVSRGGQELEGQGVTPDVVVAPTRAALLRGEDPALDAATRWIRNAT